MTSEGNNTLLESPKEETQTDKPNISPVDRYELLKPLRITTLALLASFAFFIPLSTTIYLPSLDLVIDDLKTTERLVNLTLSMYTLLIGVAPLIWGPASDRFGRRRVLLSCIAVYLVGTFFCGFAWNIAILIIARIVQAVGGAASTVVGSGSIADMYPPAQRGSAMGWFAAPVLIGPLVAPVLGGFISDGLNWRWNFYVLSISCIPVFIAAIIWMPETLDPNHKSVFNPLRPLEFLLYPRILILASANAIVFGCMYAMIYELSLVLHEEYEMGPAEIGLCYIPFGICLILGTLLGGKTSDIGARKWGRGGRLVPTIVGTGLLVGGIIGFGWFIEVFLTAGLFFTSIVGFALTLQRPAIQTYCIEEQPKHASAVSASQVVLQFLSAFLCLIAVPSLLDAVDMGWTFTLMGALAFLILIPTIYVAFSSWHERFNPHEPKKQSKVKDQHNKIELP